MNETDKIRLRAAIATEVMGWHSRPGYANWLDAEGNNQERRAPDYNFDCDECLGYISYEWKPDEDIAAAWQVQERISVNGLNKETEYLDALLEIIPFTKLDWEYRKNGSYQLGVTLQYLMVSATPEQRCLAAYKAVTGRDWE